MQTLYCLAWEFIPFHSLFDKTFHELLSITRCHGKQSHVKVLSLNEDGAQTKHTDCTKAQLLLNGWELAEVKLKIHFPSYPCIQMKLKHRFGTKWLFGNRQQWEQQMYFMLWQWHCFSELSHLCDSSEICSITKSWSYFLRLWGTSPIGQKQGQLHKSTVKVRFRGNAWKCTQTKKSFKKLHQFTKWLNWYKTWHNAVMMMSKR